MFKRTIDIFLSSIILITFSPFMLIIGILIYFIDGSPIFFVQNRVGKGKEIFKFYKFRSMKLKVDKLMHDEKRITKLGKILRKTSIDELPSFYNVLKGDMSIVGPRPLLERYTSRYNKFQIRRLEIKPGITGWAQVNGRNILSWEKRFELDVYYVDHQSFFLDMKIILLTMIHTLFAKGISPNGQEIMPEFNSEDGKKTIN